MSEASRYPIGAVAKLTGLSVDTLRMWERRYQVVAPERDGRGRLYTEEHVRHLQLLADAVSQGHSIGRLAKLSTRAVADLLDDAGLRRRVATTPGAANTTTHASLLEGIKAAVGTFDEVALEQELARLSMALPTREFVHRVALPAMRWAGEEWHADRLAAGQEHLLSASLRGLLGGLTRLSRNARASERVLFATPSGDRHEFGILAAAMLTAASGLGVVFLGAELPGEQIVESAVRSGARVVVIGHVYNDLRSHSDRELSYVAKHLPPDIELWVGGMGDARLLGLPPRVVLVPDFPTLEAHLVRVGGRL